MGKKHHEKKPRGPNDAPDESFLEVDPFYAEKDAALAALNNRLKTDPELSASITAAAASASAGAATNKVIISAVACGLLPLVNDNSGTTPDPSTTQPADVAVVDSTTNNNASPDEMVTSPPTAAATSSFVLLNTTTSDVQQHHLTITNKRVKMSALLPALHQKSLRQLMMKTLRGAVMSFLYAAIGRLILGISKSLLRSGFSWGKFLRLATREVFTANSFKWGTVAAGLSCYRLLQQLVLRISPHMPVSVSCAIGGGLASLPIMVMNVHTRTELGLYLGVRAIHGAICSEWDKIPMPESWRKSNNWAVVYMVFLAIEILYTFSFYPETHSPAYVSFVSSNTKQHHDTMHCLAGMVRRHYSPYMMKMHRQNGLNIVTKEYAQMAAEGVGGCCVKPGARVMDVNDLREACLFLHTYTKSCIYHYFNLSFRHFFTVSVPLYVPLKLSTTLLFGFKKVVRHPLQTLQKLLKSSLQSCGFLTLYACLPHLMLCCASNMQLHSPIGTCILASICGLATYLEPPSRRIDLALYCSLHGLRSLVNVLHVKGIIPKPTREWVFWLQTVAVASLFYQYDLKYEHIHPNVVSAFGWLLKEKRRKPEDVAHALEWQAKQDALREAIIEGDYLTSSTVEIPSAAGSPHNLLNTNGSLSSASVGLMGTPFSPAGASDSNATTFDDPDIPGVPIPASGANVIGDESTSAEPSPTITHQQ